MMETLIEENQRAIVEEIECENQTKIKSKCSFWALHQIKIPMVLIKSGILILSNLY